MALPRGCVPNAQRLFRENAAELAIEDQRYVGAPLAHKFSGELTPVQREAARALLAHDTGVFVGPPGIGKTVLGTYLVAQRGCATLILVHRKPLLEQWIAQLAMFLGLDEKAIGQIGGGKRKANGRLDVAMIQSLVRRDKVEDVVAGYGHVIVDECHHLPAVSFERVLSEVKARFIVGLDRYAAAARRTSPDYRNAAWAGSLQRRASRVTLRAARSSISSSSARLHSG